MSTQSEKLPATLNSISGTPTKDVDAKAVTIQKPRKAVSSTSSAKTPKPQSGASEKLESLREALRTHSRYIRDELGPLLIREPAMTGPDSATIRSIFRLLKSTAITLDDLRFSRMEKALQLIVVTGASVWPMDVVVEAENTLQRWEDRFGQGSLKNLRADLWGEGGRLEGVRRIRDRRFRDEACASVMFLRLS